MRGLSATMAARLVCLIAILALALELPQFSDAISAQEEEILDHEASDIVHRVRRDSTINHGRQGGRHGALEASARAIGVAANGRRDQESSARQHRSGARSVQRARAGSRRSNKLFKRDLPASTARSAVDPADCDCTQISNAATSNGVNLGSTLNALSSDIKRQAKARTGDQATVDAQLPFGLGLLPKNLFGGFSFGGQGETNDQPESAGGVADEIAEAKSLQAEVKDLSKEARGDGAGKGAMAKVIKERDVLAKEAAKQKSAEAKGNVEPADRSAVAAASNTRAKTEGQKVNTNPALARSGKGRVNTGSTVLSADDDELTGDLEIDAKRQKSLMQKIKSSGGQGMLARGADPSASALGALNAAVGGVAAQFGQNFGGALRGGAKEVEKVKEIEPKAGEEQLEEEEELAEKERGKVEGDLADKGVKLEGKVESLAPRVGEKVNELKLNSAETGKKMEENKKTEPEGSEEEPLEALEGHQVDQEQGQRPRTGEIGKFLFNSVVTKTVASSSKDPLGASVELPSADLEAAKAELGTVTGELNVATDELKPALGELSLGVAEAEAGKAELGAAAGELATGVDEVKKDLGVLKTGHHLVGGAAELVSGEGALKGGKVELASGAQGLKPAFGELAAGLAEVKAGKAELGAAAGELAAGVGEVKGGLDELIGGVGKLKTGDLKGGAAELKAGAGELVSGKAELGAALGELKAAKTEAVAEALETVAEVKKEEVKEAELPLIKEPYAGEPKKKELLKAKEAAVKKAKLGKKILKPKEILAVPVTKLETDEEEETKVTKKVVEEFDLAEKKDDLEVEKLKGYYSAAKLKEAELKVAEAVAEAEALIKLRASQSLAHQPQQLYRKAARPTLNPVGAIKKYYGAPQIHQPKYPLYQSPKLTLVPKCRAKVKLLEGGLNELLKIVGDLGETLLLNKSLPYVIRDSVSRRFGRIKKWVHEARLAANLARFEAVNEGIRAIGLEITRVTQNVAVKKIEPKVEGFKIFAEKLRKLYGGFRKACKY